VKVEKKTQAAITAKKRQLRTTATDGLFRGPKKKRKGKEEQKERDGDYSNQ